ncbi:MAG: YbhN family protein [Candidatus Binatia bacterium]
MSDLERFSLKRELVKKKTLFSALLCFLLLSLFFSRARLSEVGQALLHVNLAFLLLAFFSHYLAYLFRGCRWKRIVSRLGFRGKSLDLARIILLFQALDCLIPARLGDLYGAHLMKLNFSLSRSSSLGSIFLWRILDAATMLSLIPCTALLLFKRQIPPELTFILRVLQVGALLIPALVLLFLFGRKVILPHLPFGQRLKQVIDSFEEGLKPKMGALPSLLLSTVWVWLLEIGRFYFICRAFSLRLGLIEVAFISLVVTLTTAIPLTPSGLGAVELVMVRLLTLARVDGALVYPITLLDRAIAHWSQILLGAFFFTFSGRLKVRN